MHHSSYRSPSLLSLVLVALVAACGGEPESPGAVDAGEEMSAALSVPRTADPGQRGLAEEDFPRVQQRAENVYSYEALRSAGDERFTTVSLFVVTPEGVLVADGQGNVEETERMIAAIGDITDQPITHLVICSDHGDHTAGNSAFSGDLTVYAHPTSAALLQSAADRRAASGTPSSSAPLPDVLVRDVERVTLGGTEIEIHFLGRAHTGGDLVVYLPAEKILFMSEAYLNRVFPAMRSAYPSEWVTMIERAQAMEAETYVPGHGFVESPAVLEEELEVYRQAVAQVIAESRRLHEAGVPLEDAAQMADFGDLERWSLSSSQRARAIQQVYAEIEGTLPGG